MTWKNRIDNYHKETKFPESLFLAGDGRVVGIWIMGNNYQVKSSFYGGYPPTYLRRVKALFPDKRKVLHLFSGRVDQSELPGTTVDLDPNNNPDILDDAQTLEKVPVQDFDLICCDPPYSVEDAEHYGPSMVKRNKVMDALMERMHDNAHIVWLDQVLPMYRKADVRIAAHIGMVKSTNHRFRVVNIFEKAL